MIWDRKTESFVTSFLMAGRTQSVLLNNVAGGSQGSANSHYKTEVDDCRGKTDTEFFELSTIIAATNNFLYSNRLGQGGFGSVYKVLNVKHV